MTQLDFDYCPSEQCEIAEYGELRIKAERDEYISDCPWEAWDGNVPCIAAFADRHRSDFREYDKDAGFDLLRPFASGGPISDAILRRHMSALVAIFDGFDCCNALTGARQSFSTWFHDEAKDNHARYGGSLTEYKRDALQSALDDIGNAGDKLEALASIYQTLGYPALSTSSRGYSQGDYADVLFVVTPQFAKAMGCKASHDWQRDMESASKLFDAWAWGDVYSFTIEAPISFDDDGEPDEWESLDSCGGFYGHDHEWSGLAEHAKNAADCIIASRKKQRGERVKELIRNRVPLALRAAAIAEASEYRSAWR